MDGEMHRDELMRGTRGTRQNALEFSIKSFEEQDASTKEILKRARRFEDFVNNGTVDNADVEQEN